MRIRTFRELRRLRTFEERYEYLKIGAKIGASTFGYDRYLNQLLYTSDEWKKTRDGIIIRDDGNDLGVEGYRIYSRILIHHMNPITIEDIELGRYVVFDPENLICTTLKTHNAIHYGSAALLPKPPIERTKYDTCPWKK